jgi:hypothetical protein
MEQQGKEPSGKSCAKQAAVKTVFTEDRSSYLDGVPPGWFPAKSPARRRLSSASDISAGFERRCYAFSSTQYCPAGLLTNINLDMDQRCFTAVAPAWIYAFDEVSNRCKIFCSYPSRAKCEASAGPDFHESVYTLYERFLQATLQNFPYFFFAAVS